MFQEDNTRRDIETVATQQTSDVKLMWRSPKIRGIGVGRTNGKVPSPIETTIALSVRGAS